MVRIDINITKEQRDALKKLVTNRISLAEHVRRAIDEYLERIKQQ